MKTATAKTPKAAKLPAVIKGGIAGQGKPLPLPPVAKNEAPAVSKSVIPTHYRKSYNVFREDERRTSGGNPTICNGDKVAMLLLGKSVDETFTIVADEMAKIDPTRGITKQWLQTKYAGKNDGMKRMNAGNILRNTIKRAAAQPK